MVIHDENVKKQILGRLREREARLSAEQMAELRIAEELDALAIATRKNSDDVYESLVKIGHCFSLLKMPNEALKYFSQAAEEFPDKKFPVFAVVMTLKQLGRYDEAEKYALKIKEKFPG